MKVNPMDAIYHLEKHVFDLRDALQWALDQIDDDPDPEHKAALAAARELLEF